MKYVHLEGSKYMKTVRKKNNGHNFFYKYVYNRQRDRQTERKNAVSTAKKMKKLMHTLVKQEHSDSTDLCLNLISSC